MTRIPTTNFSLPLAYPIINVDTEDDPFSFARVFLNEGATIIQLRSKTFSEATFLDCARKMLQLRDEFSLQHHERPYCRVVINDSIAVCQAAGADGVHLGQEDQPPFEARRILGQTAIIGLSTHNREQALAAPFPFLDYLALGPIFDSPTKSGHAPLVGLSALQEISALVPLPVVAIGGIHSQNAKAVLHAGASTLALISAVKENPALIRTIARE